MRDFLKLATKHTLIFSIGDIAQKSVGFLLLPIYMRCLSPEDYGVLEILTILSMVFSGVILQGLPTAFFRAYSFDYAKDEQKQRNAIYTAYTYLLLCSFIIYFLLFTTAPFWSKVFFKEGNFTKFIRIVFITQCFNCSSIVPFVILRAKLLSAWVAGIALVRVIIGTSMTIWFVVFRNMGIEGVLLAQMIMSILVFLGSPLIPIIIHRKFYFCISLEKLKGMLVFGWPLVPGIFSAWIMTSADRYFLEHFSTRYQLGLYSVGFKLASILSIVFIAPFRKTWPAIFYPKAQEGDAKQVFSCFATYFLLSGSIASLGIICVSDSLIKLMGPKEYWGASMVVPILVTSILVHGFQATLNLGLFVQNKTKYAPLIVICAAVANVILNAMLVPRFGMIGAATATLLSYFLMLAITLAINQRIYPVPYEYRRISHISAVFFLIAAANYVFQFDAFLWSISIKFALFSSFILILLLTNFFTKPELSILKQYSLRFTPFSIKLIKEMIRYPKKKL